jgi:hypothetical protein
MDWKKYNLDMENNILMKVKEGMKVYDSKDHEIGKVDDVFLGAVTPADESAGEGPATVESPPSNAMEKDRVTPNFAFGGAFDWPDNSEEHRIARDRLLQEGFLRIDPSVPLEKERYVLPEQIASVGNDDVHLKVSDDQLIRA